MLIIKYFSPFPKGLIFLNSGDLFAPVINLVSIISKGIFIILKTIKTAREGYDK